MDEASGFFETPNDAQSATQGQFELISGSKDSYCDLWRTDKDGRFRVYKALKREYAGDPVYERLLRKEFEIGYSLSHPNICEYYGFVNIPQLGNCIEMEWIDGCSLDSLMERKAISKALAVKIINEICDALSYMHSKQIIHRDLKPSNIMLTYNGNNVKLIDFGLSDSDSHSVLKGSAGTQVYASPEQISGGVVDFRSDIFSLGCVIDRICPSLAKVARKCCRRDPEKRFQSAQEVKEAIAGRHRASIIVVAVVLAALGAVLISNRHAAGSIPDESLISSEVEDSVTATHEEPSTAPIPSVSEDKRPSESPVREHSKSTATEGKRNIPESKSDSGQEAIDELFRQATELFDQ